MDSMNSPAAVIRVLSSGTRAFPDKRTFEMFGERITKHYIIAYITEGEGHFAAKNMEKRPVKAGDVLICFPGIWHRYGPDKDMPWMEYWVAFDGFIPDHYRTTLVLDPANPVLSAGVERASIAKWEHLIERDTSHASAGDVAAAAFTVLMDIIEHASSGGMPKGEKARIIARFTQRMQKHIRSTAFDFRSACTGERYGYSYLRKLFKQYTGSSPDEYFRLMKITKAKELLISGEETIHAIARRFGFYDQFHFTRSFKKALGMTPRDYRRSFGGR